MGKMKAAKDTVPGMCQQVVVLWRAGDYEAALGVLWHVQNTISKEFLDKRTAARSRLRNWGKENENQQGRRPQAWN